MKIYSPLFTTEQHGSLFGLLYFSGSEGSTRLSRMPRQEKRPHSHPVSARARLTATLHRWQTIPADHPERWPQYAKRWLTSTQPHSEATITGHIRQVNGSATIRTNIDLSTSQ